jgi:hypothetical protein
MDWPTSKFLFKIASDRIYPFSYLSHVSNLDRILALYRDDWITQKPLTFVE